MNYLQEPKITLNEKFKKRFLSLLLFFNLFAVIMTFTLNFLGLPILKYQYLFHVLLSLVGILFFELPQIFPIILTLFFLEGQGRIIWEYNSWARIIFDTLVFTSVLKIFIVKKKIIDFKITPVPFAVIIALHFLWYAVECSNLNSVSYFSIIAATKVYIYPILFFLGITQLDFDINKKQFQNCINFFILLIILELALTFYQFSLKEHFLIQLSPYYAKAMRQGIFTGKFFRPFATTQLPGAISSFLFLTVGFLFFKIKSKIGNILRTILICASGYAIVLCQVRSAFIKFLLIIFVIHLGELIFYRFKTKSFISLILVLIIFVSTSQFIANDKLSTGDTGVDYARDRLLSLGDVDKIKGSRLNTSSFTIMVSQKLMKYPLGLGPGLTGPVGSLAQDALVGNRFINSDTTWTADNLFIALVIDFGIGAIFYILLLLYIPIYFLRFIVIFYRNKFYEPYKILLICFSSVTVIILGNWGANGITYNPESFAFWFFAAVGFSTISKYKNLNPIAISN